ncbi:MAG: response regulator [Deltaproteobacteria bacterium]|nr:MAG: response regulator [Deltaproteobacteria bacterium]
MRSAGTILVVDDNLDTNEALARLLATRGYRWKKGSTSTPCST